jgi:hypothetical protein
MGSMREYYVVIAKLAERSRADEETLTDLLNERARAGWRFLNMTPLGSTRMAVVFDRESA